MTLSDTTSWIAVGAAIGSAAIALALAIVVVVLFIRLRRREPPANDVDRMLREADGRFELMLRDLSDQLERAREGARRSSRLSGLTSSIDLESVNRARGGGGGRSPRHRCGDARRPASDEEPLLVSAGMSRAEAERRMLPPAPDPAARSIGVAYRYAEEEAGEGTRVTGGLVVPLPASESAIGTLAVFWRGGAPSAAMSAELDLLEELAASAGAAVENAIKFRDASRLADLDALTGLHNRRFFHETLGRECDRAPGTSAASRSSSSTSTTSRRSTTGSDTSPATRCSPSSQIAYARSFGRPMSPAGSAATSSRSSSPSRRSTTRSTSSADSGTSCPSARRARSTASRSRAASPSFSRATPL